MPINTGKNNPKSLKEKYKYEFMQEIGTSADIKRVQKKEKQE